MTSLSFISSEQDIKPIVDTKVDDFLNTCVEDIKDIVIDKYDVVSGFDTRHVLSDKYNQLVSELKEVIKEHIFFNLNLHEIVDVEEE